MTDRPGGGEEELRARILELETRLRTIYWMDAKNAGLTDDEARENADARLHSKPRSLTKATDTAGGGT